MPENNRQGVVNFRVRYCECDPMGVAHHSSHPIWFEMGRTELLRETVNRSYREMEEEGVFLVVAKLEVRYRQPARYDDELQLETVLTEVGRAKIRHEYTLRRGTAVLATGSTTLASVDSNGSIKPIPSWINPD